MKSESGPFFQKLVAIMLLVSIICSNIAIPVSAVPEKAVNESTRKSLVFEKPEGIYSSDSGSGLFSRGTARNGKYTGQDGSSITWKLTSAGALTVSGTGCLPRIWFDNSGNFFGADIKTVSIGSGITELDNGTFYECSNLTKATLPTTLTMIGFASFAECTRLASINIPAAVSYIGEYAFLDCQALPSVTLPKSVTMIDTEAFAACTALTKASIYGDIGVNAFNSCIALSSLTINGTPTYIADGAFAYCSSLTSVKVPSSVTEIGLGAFAYCESLTTANLYGDLLESAFDCCYALKSVTLNGTARSIGRRAFAECRALESISLPDSLTIIDAAAFQECEKLSSINLPANLKTLKDHAFYKCSSLKGITIPSQINQIDDALFAYCAALTDVNLHEGITSIGYGSFGSCTALSSLILPSTCKTIGEQSFYGCTNLQSITLPTSLTEIGDAAFYQCEKLQSISIPKNVKEIPNHAFALCKSLNSVSLPSGLNAIGNYAFSSCESLRSISVPAGVTALLEGVFAQCKSLNSITLPDNITEIEKAAFFNCETLSNINIPASLTNLGWASFAGCKNLQSIVLPSGVSEVLESTFLNCEKLESVVFAGNVTSIGDNCFSSCTSLKSISLPNTVSTIGRQAFAFCNNLTVVNMPQQLKTLGTAAFLGCEKMKNIAIGRNVQSIGEDAFSACTSLSSLTIDSSNPNFTIIDGILYSADKTKLIFVIPGSSLVSVTIPNTVQSLGVMAFYQCKNIRSITLPSTITEIGNLMFYNCTELESITIPGSVKKIGNYAFAECEKLQTVAIPSSVQSIGEGAFYNCKRIANVDIPSGINIVSHAAFLGCTSLKNLTLPDTVVKIDDYAFALCSSLSTASLPQSLKTIGQYAFAGCDSLDISSVPSGVTSLGEGAFAECPSLKSISLPSGIANISDFLFYDCPSLESVDLRGDVYAIGVGSFSSSEALEKVVFAGNAPEVIGAKAFEKTSSDLTLHYEQAAKGWTTPKWTGPDQAVYQTSTAYSGTCGKNLEWNLVTATGELTIWGTGEMYSWDEASDTPWNQYAGLIKRVKIEDGVTSIGASAFRSCPKLVSVEIASTVEKAGYAAFADCLSLNYVECDGGLRDVSECMFYNDDQLFSINLSNALKSIPNYAFYGCCNLIDVNLPASVETIGEGAFAGDASIETVVFGSRIESIGSGAFLNCAGLSKIYTDSKKPNSIGDYAFYGCNEKLSVVGATDTSWLKVENTVAVSTEHQEILSGSAGELSWRFVLEDGSLIISGTGELPDYDQGTAPWLMFSSLISSIKVEDGVTYIGEMAFSEMSCVEKITLPDSVRSIGPYAFAGCIALTDCTLPAGLTSIGEGAFNCCEFLTTVELPAAITDIPAYLCSECYNLKKVIALGKINSVGYGAFDSCVNLGSTNFLQNVNTIESWAFAFCHSLSDFVKVEGEIGDHAFFCCWKVENVDLTSTVSIGEYAFSQSGVKKVSIDFATIPVSAFEMCDSLTEVTCLEKVRNIEADAFYGCEQLEKVQLRNVTRIDDFAFMASGISGVIIPDSVSFLGNGVFADCGRLAEIQASGEFQSIDGVLYQGNRLLQYPAGKTLDSFVIPKSVNIISDFGFYGCKNLKTVKVGNSVSCLGKASFAYCDALTEIVLGYGIHVLPEAVFGEDNNLIAILCCGDALTKIEQDALYKTSERLVIKYLSGTSGWSDKEWIGPDGEKYSTECITENYVTSLTMVDNSSMMLHVTSIVPTDENLVIVVSAKKSGKTVATKAKIIPSESTEFRITINGDSADVFLLDERTAAPLTAQMSLHGFSPPVIDNDSITIEEESAHVLLLPRTLTLDDQHKVFTNVVQDITLTEYKARSVDSTTPCVITTYTLDKGSILNWTHAFGKNTGISIGITTRNVSFRFEDARALAGDYKEGNALGYSEAKLQNNFTFRDAKGQFMRPRFQHYAHYDVGIMSLRPESKSALFRDTVKTKISRQTKIGHFQIDEAIDTEGELDLSAKLKLAETEFTIAGYGAQRGEQLYELTGELGVGPGISASAPLGEYGSITSVTPEAISIGIGLKPTKNGWDPEGINANMKLKVYTKETWDFLSAEYSDELADWSNAMRGILVKVVDNANHDVDQETFIRYTVDAQNNAKDAWVVAKNKAKYSPGDETYCKALPKSQGGTQMPKDSSQQTGQQSGGGNVNSTGKTNDLTQKEKDAIQQATVGAELAGKVPPIWIVDQGVGNTSASVNELITIHTEQQTVFGRVLEQGETNTYYRWDGINFTITNSILSQISRWGIF